MFHNVICHVLGCFAQNRGDLDRAEVMYQRALATYQEENATRRLFALYYDRGTVAWETGDLAQAEVMYRQALFYCRKWAANLRRSETQRRLNAFHEERLQARLVEIRKGASRQ